MGYELKDMNLNPGDVVGFLAGRPGGVGWVNEVTREYTVDDLCEKITHPDGGWSYIAENHLGPRFIVVSRATPVPFGKLTPIEQQELRDAADRGEAISYRWSIEDWSEGLRDKKWAWLDGYYYRIAPTPVEETVTITCDMDANGDLFPSTVEDDLDTRRVTLPLLDGNLRPGTYTDEDGHKVVIEDVTAPVQIGDTITIQMTDYITVRGECHAIRDDGYYEVKSPEGNLWIGTLLTPEKTATSE